MLSKQASYDVIIIGSRIAGSVLAVALAEHGHRVLVLDRSHFPSDTLSTHFFRAPALRAFRRIGVYERIVSLAPKLTVDYNVVDGIVFPEPVNRPEDYPFYMCVRRITLDDVLVQRVRQTPDVHLREGASVSALLWEDGHVVGARWKASDGPGQARARAVVGADGVYSFVARQVRPRVEHEEPVNRAMYYAYFSGIEPNDGPAAEFHYRGDHLVYLFPCDAGLFLLAASVPISKFGEFKKDPEGQLLKELHAMNKVSPRLQRATRQAPVRGTGNIPGYLRVPYGPGWALVGDAGMVMDPWSGQGIDQASTHALMLADGLHQVLTGELAWGEAMAAYHQARNDFSLKTYRRTCTFGRDLRPMTRKALERRGLL